MRPKSKVFVHALLSLPSIIRQSVLKTKSSASCKHCWKAAFRYLQLKLRKQLLRSQLAIYKCFSNTSKVWLGAKLMTKCAKTLRSNSISCMRQCGDCWSMPRKASSIPSLHRKGSSTTWAQSSSNAFLSIQIESLICWRQWWRGRKSGMMISCLTS